MSAISAAQTATSTTTTSSTSGQTKQHHHHHHQPLSSASHSQSAANLLSTSTSHPHQPSSISPKAASSSTASETASTTTGSIGTSTTNSSATNSITEGANNGATTATTTITTVNPNHDSSSSSSSVTAAAPYHPPSISNGSTNGSTSTHKQTNGSSSISGSNNNGNMSGYLFKWTNYLKGYQKRWIFLNNGFLSYYRSPNEMDHTCRGAINLANAHIQQNDDGVSFVVSNGGNQTFHLRAANDQERQKWISALETAKNKAPRPYHHGGAQQHPSSYINGIPSGKVGGGGGSSSSNAGGDLSDDDDENGAASTDAERNELESFLQVLQHKLNELSLSHEFVLKHSNMLTKSLTELENIQSKPDETAIKTINERSTIYKVAMNGVLNNCQEFINLAQFHTRKMHKILQSEHEIRLRLEDMVQEMAKQHLNIETQLSKRGKRIMAKGTPTTTNQSVSNKSQPSGGGVGGGTIKGGGQQQQSTNNQQQQSAQQSSSQHQQKPSQETKSSAAAGSNVGAGNVNSNEEDEDETYVANDDEFHDAVEDVTQFSVTLPRGKGLHQRNPSNISKLYLQESDDDEDEYDNSENDDGRATTIKVTMHSAATSADEAKTAPTTTTTSSAPTATAHATDKTISNGGALVKKKPSQMDLAVTKRGPPRQRRTQITPRPNYSINLWSIMKNCIGKDLSKIPIPVNFSEPISMLQRITEELEYAQLLDQAADCEDQWEQMALVAAFTVTSYSTTATRTNKPFNPLLGETFEFDRSDDLGWRSISEQVGHHPPGFAFHAESVKDWAFYQEFTMSSKFRGQYLQVVPLGTSHLEFKKSGHHYTWRKVSTFVRNIIVGKLWIDNVGEMDIINHKTKDVCHLKYFPYSYFSREPPRKVTGIITDANNVARYVLNGTWTEQIEGAPVLNPQVVTTSSTQLTTGKSKILWKRKYPPPYLESMYNFTEFAVQLNEPEDGVAPTDSRRRPDQRLMEEARWDEANQEKLRLEEKQRTNRKAREAAAAAAAAAAATANMPNSIDPPSSSSLSSSTTTNNNNDENDDEDIEKMMRRQATHKSNEPEATWFKRVIDPYTNLPIHVFKNEYWECKAKQDWSRCPDLF